MKNERSPSEVITLYYGIVKRLGIILDSYYVRNDVKLVLTILFFLKYPPRVAVMVVAEFESQHRNSNKQLSQRTQGSTGNTR